MLKTTRCSAVAPATMNRSKYKLVFLGDTPVGKSSIVKRYIYDQFEFHPYPTVGIDFLSKTMYLKDRMVRLLIWDTTGHEQFRSLIPSYIRDSHVAIVVYDVTDRASFFNATMWVDLIRTEVGSNTIIILVGNKTDLKDKRQVETSEGEEQAKMDGLLFTECSAKSGENVQSLFQLIATTLSIRENRSNNDAIGSTTQKVDADGENPDAGQSKNVGGSWCECVAKLGTYFNPSKGNENS